MKGLRCRYEFARETIIACAVLHNIGVLWADEVPDDEAMGPPNAPPTVDAAPVEEGYEEPALIRARGQALRRPPASEHGPLLTHKSPGVLFLEFFA